MKCAHRTRLRKFTHTTKTSILDLPVSTLANVMLADGHGPDGITVLIKR